MKDLFNWFTWYESDADDADSNLNCAYYAMMVLFGIALLRWGALL